MTKVENQNGVWYVPDKIANDPTKSVADILKYAIPWDEYEKKTLIPQRIKEIKEQLKALEKEPDMVRNEEKFNQIDMLTEELDKLQNQ